MRRHLHLVLVFALLLLGWLQLAHDTDLHAHQNNGSCELCLFTGHLGDGAAASMALPAATPQSFVYELTRYAAPTLSHPFRLAQSPRGPPHQTAV